MSRYLQITAVKNYRPTPEEIADVFWAMDDSEQAAFFNRLANIAGGRIAQQMCYVSQHPDLSIKAKVLISTIGEYGD